MSILSDKLVVTRKDHTCLFCCRVFPSGSTMKKVACIFDGDFNAFYHCKQCETIIGLFDAEDYEDGYTEYCVVEAAQGNKYGFIPSSASLTVSELLNEFECYLIRTSKS